tara:strand:+ start:261 stop:431 length:171 start_codon:yes stop_codon:yes gene_type:complete
MDLKTKEPVKTVERIFNATSMHHIDLHKEDGILVKRVYVQRDDAEENISSIFGQID